MSNKIVYQAMKNGSLQSLTLTDADLVMGEGKIFASNPIVAESLEIDTIQFQIIVSDNLYKDRLCDITGEPLSDVNGIPLYVVDRNEEWDFIDFQYGSEILYYRNDVLEGKFFTRLSRQAGKNVFYIEGMSAIGLLDRVKHHGGVYTFTRAGDIIADIFGQIPYSISSDVANVYISGWLPSASGRNNLQQVLFATGGAVSKDDQKNVMISFLGSESATQINPERIYDDGTVDYLTQVTKVEITEHEYYNLSEDEEVTLFDNTDGSGTAENYEVEFEQPSHSLVSSSGLTIIESGANYAIVSGVGTLKGKKYTHTTRIITKVTDEIAEENIKQVSDMTLVTGLNSINVAERVANYYKRIKEVKVGIALDELDILPTDKIEFIDPFGNLQTGYVKNVEKTFSNTTKVQATVVTDFEPGSFGSNYKNYILLTGSGTWIVPDGVSRIRATLIGGGQGGYGGSAGTKGEDGTITMGVSSLPLNRQTAHQGQKGKGARGGDGGKIYAEDLDVVSGQSFAYVAGSGGSGGLKTDNGNPDYHTQGSIGSASTFGELSSESGSTSASGVVNLFTGEYYGRRGISGVDGSDNEKIYSGDAVWTWGNWGDDEYLAESYGTGSRGEAAVSYRARIYGGMPGLPALGANGGSGSGGGITFFRRLSRIATYDNAILLRSYGGTGGNGKPPHIVEELGSGGNGGNGGGAGGGGGCGCIEIRSGTSQLQEITAPGGPGGTGSNGGRGADGCILIYY